VLFLSRFKGTAVSFQGGPFFSRGTDPSKA
jgi:hypothetical protein